MFGQQSKEKSSSKNGAAPRKMHSLIDPILNEEISPDGRDDSSFY
jgi:hypothetical protein